MEAVKYDAINLLSSKVYLRILDICGNHEDKNMCREHFVDLLNKNRLIDLGLDSDTKNSIEALNAEDKKMFIALLYLDRTGRSLKEIGLEAGISYSDLEKLDSGEL